MVLNEPSKRFYLFLEHALKIEAETQYSLLNSSLFPYIKEDKQAEILEQYQNIINDIDIVEKKETNIQDDREQLKILLNNQL